MDYELFKSRSVTNKLLVNSKKKKGQVKHRGAFTGLSTIIILLFISFFVEKIFKILLYLCILIIAIILIFYLLS